jgi:hypothetical protein
MLGMLMAFSHHNARDQIIAQRFPEEPESELKLEAVE